MNPRAIYEMELNNEALSEEYRAAMRQMSEEEIEDAYYRDIAFGTAGIRGRMGPGRNRMNIYTIRRVSYALGRYLNTIAEHPVAVIAHDSRLNSETFTEETACTLASLGITVHLFRAVTSTPELSFTVRHLQADGGVVITASHNPKDYNGYKVYHPSGRQVLEDEAAQILTYYEEAPAAEDIAVGCLEDWIEAGRIQWLDESMNQAYDAAIQKAVRDPEALKEADRLRVVYTPLHGTGGRGILQSLRTLGVGEIHPVAEEFEPDGSFPAVPVPNPEDPRVFENARILGEKVGADLLIATDPDADRLGVMVWQDGEYTMIDGNQMGIIMLDYLLEKGDRGDVISTIVSTRLVERLCAPYGVKVHRCLTGFKYIGEIMNGLEQFTLGFEESYGYVNGMHVRDKDAINSATLLCEMASEAKAHGENLLDRLYRVYQKHGYYLEDQIVIMVEGQAGAAEIDRIMDNFRKNPLQVLRGRALEKVVDYEKDDTGLPPSKVLKWFYEDDFFVAIRPSGTEPKLKIYFGATGANAHDVDMHIKAIALRMNELI